MNDALRDGLRDQAVRLSQAVLDRMYENSFWMERYGIRGRRFADEDSLHHVRYLDQALAAADARIFEKYARWLRSVLVSRGMCSDHLGEHFRLLADAIAGAGLPGAEAAVAVLQAGDRALHYTEGEAGALQRRVELLAAAVASTPSGAAMRDDDRRYLVSYALDAAAVATRVHFDTFAARCPRDAVDALTSAIDRLRHSGQP